MSKAVESLARLYRWIGIHTAPPGTLFHTVHSRLRTFILRDVLRYSSAERPVRGKFGGTAYYDVRRSRSRRDVDGLALVFFMGAGDYLMATPFIEALHLAHPDLPIYAYASSTTDRVNSPLVLELLKKNPNIDKVFAYRGRRRNFWKDYDFREATQLIPGNFLVLPVIYDTDPVVYHRVTSLLEAFSLPVDLPVSPPLLYPADLSPAGQAVLALIRQKSAALGLKKAICVHLGTRSSGYMYPHARDLAARLLRLGFLLVTFTPTELQHNALVEIDVTTLTPTDSIEIMRAMQAEMAQTFMVTVNSLMWPISAGLGIPNLGLHIFRDDSIHQYLYPNLFVITTEYYPTASPSRVFLVPDGAFEYRVTATVGAFTDYDPNFVVEAFRDVVRTCTGGRV